MVHRIRANFRKFLSSRVEVEVDLRLGVAWEVDLAEEGAVEALEWVDLASSEVD